MNEAYIDQITRLVPRVLGLYDNDFTSKSYGMGDRFRWGWKLIDFGNGTFQGLAHGLSVLVNLDSIPLILSSEKLLSRIDSIFKGARTLMRKNGSYEEAFPYESSYCVSALVAFDLLSALENLDHILSKERKEEYLSVIEPTIQFLSSSKETHAFISNHLATASAAHIKWGHLTADKDKGFNKGDQILASIIKNQSNEGWYLEYEGADPGYQSLCTYYLADIYRMTQQNELLESLKKSLKFLWCFAHPDGSFGGVYGSRNTRFYYPGGVEFLSQYSDEANALATYMKKSIQEYRVVTLNTMDAHNLIPMFNSYCYALQHGINLNSKRSVPSVQKKPFVKYFSEAGLFIDKGKHHYSVIATRKGGVSYHFARGRKLEVDSSALIDYKGKKYSAQIFNSASRVRTESKKIEIETDFYAITQSLPSVFQFIILRILNLTIMRFSFISQIIKLMLVRLLITNKKKSGHKLKRVISLGQYLQISDEITGKPGYTVLNSKRIYYAIHMASQGYWQIQDDT